MNRKKQGEARLKDVEFIVACLISGSYVKATKYWSEDYIVRGVRRTSRKKIDKRDRSIYISLMVGKPNYAEREFIRMCKKSGEPFPIKKVQLKLYNPKKLKLKRKK